MEMPVHSVVDAYCRQCAISMSCVELTKAALFLSNGGVVLSTGERILDSSSAKRLSALMLTSGMYDAAGDFVYRVGLPAKSGAGGGIVAVLAGEMAVCVWSPGLDSNGNSLAGVTDAEFASGRSRPDSVSERLCTYRDAVIPLADIAQFPLILQGALSGTGFIYTRFPQKHGIDMQKVLASNSLIAQIGQTLSGLGVSYLPKACLGHMLERGSLDIIRTRPALPPVSYVALHRAEQAHTLTAAIAQLASQCCDFGLNLLDPSRQ